jgi:hypothetical protein
MKNYSYSLLLVIASVNLYTHGMHTHAMDNPMKTAAKSTAVENSMISYARSLGITDQREILDSTHILDIVASFSPHYVPAELVVQIYRLVQKYEHQKIQNGFVLKRSITMPWGCFVDAEKFQSFFSRKSNIQNMVANAEGFSEEILNKIYDDYEPLPFIHHDIIWRNVECADGVDGTDIFRSPIIDFSLEQFITKELQYEQLNPGPNPASKSFIKKRLRQTGLVHPDATIEVDLTTQKCLVSISPRYRKGSRTYPTLISTNKNKMLVSESRPNNKTILDVWKIGQSGECNFLYDMQLPPHISIFQQYVFNNILIAMHEMDTDSIDDSMEVASSGEMSIEQQGVLFFDLKKKEIIFTLLSNSNELIAFHPPYLVLHEDEWKEAVKHNVIHIWQLKE